MLVGAGRYWHMLSHASTLWNDHSSAIPRKKQRATSSPAQLKSRVGKKPRASTGAWLFVVIISRLQHSMC